jgi:hypothetical protein
VLALAVYVSAVFDLPGLVRLPTGRVNPENYARVEKGMTQQEVEGLLGPPSRLKDGYGEWWSGPVSYTQNTNIVFVSFNDNGRVESKEIIVIHVSRAPRFFR